MRKIDKVNTLTQKGMNFVKQKKKTIKKQEIKKPKKEYGKPKIKAISKPEFHCYRPQRLEYGKNAFQILMQNAKKQNKVKWRKRNVTKYPVDHRPKSVYCECKICKCKM